MIAVDEDSNQSVPSDTVTGRGMFFNKNLLVVLERDWTVDSTITDSRFHSMLSDIPHDEVILNVGQYLELSREDIGQYRTIFWIADNFFTYIPIGNKLLFFNKQNNGNKNQKFSFAD